MKLPETGASTSTSAAATRVDVDFVLAPRKPLPRPKPLGTIATVVKLGVPELPVLGPIALIATLTAQVPRFFRATPNVETDIGYGAIVVGSVWLALLVAAFGISLGSIRIDSRARGEPLRLGDATLARAIRVTPATFAIVVAAFSLCAVANALTTLSGSFVVLVLPTSFAVLTFLGARTATSVTYAAVDGLGPLDAIARAWSSSKRHTGRFIGQMMIALTVSTVALYGVLLAAVAMAAFVQGSLSAPTPDAIWFPLAFVVVGVVVPLDVAFVYALYARSRS